MRKAASVAIIKNKKILLVKKEKTWILPGGKPEPCDRRSAINCLHREIGEELPRIRLVNISYYKNFQGVTPNTGDTLEARVYFSDFKGNEKITSNEISESKWFEVNEILKYKISDISMKIVESLKEENYL